MSCGYFIFLAVIGLKTFYTSAEEQKDLQNNPPPAWYHLAAHQQPTDQSPYGPRQTGSNRPDSSFVPIPSPFQPSPFQLPKSKSPQEIAASQIVNAAQERRQKDFYTNDDYYEDAETDAESIDYSLNDNHQELYWRHHARRRRPSRPKTTESPLKRILSREITNLERYLPLLARKIGKNHTLNGVIQPQSRHKTTTPIFLPSPVPTTSILSLRRKLITTTPTSTTHYGKQRTKCHNCDSKEVEEWEEDPITTTPVPRRRKTTKKLEPCRSRKQTTRRPMPTLQVVQSFRTTLRPFIESTDRPAFTRHPHKSFAKWTKFTLSSRVVDPFVRQIATLRPILTEMPMLIETTTIKSTNTQTESTKSSSTRTRRIFGLREIKTEPWTHREQIKVDVACPNGEVSPIELAIVWLVDHLRNKTAASTELIEAVKDALARFRSTLNHNRAASPPALGDLGSMGSELEMTWNELKKGTWLERAFAELAFSDAFGNQEGGPDAETAKHKVDELWREAVLASALSSQNADLKEADKLEPSQKRKATQLFHDPSQQMLRDSPVKTTETALNCETFPLMCSILRTLKSNDLQTTTLGSIPSSSSAKTPKSNKF